MATISWTRRPRRLWVMEYLHWPLCRVRDPCRDLWVRLHRMVSTYSSRSTGTMGRRRLGGHCGEHLLRLDPRDGIHEDHHEGWRIAEPASWPTKEKATRRWSPTAQASSTGTHESTWRYSTVQTCTAQVLEWRQVARTVWGAPMGNKREGQGDPHLHAGC